MKITDATRTIRLENNSTIPYIVVIELGYGMEKLIDSRDVYSLQTVKIDFLPESVGSIFGYGPPYFSILKKQNMSAKKSVIEENVPLPETDVCLIISGTYERLSKTYVPCSIPTATPSPSSSTTQKSDLTRGMDDSWVQISSSNDRRKV